jgi:DNA (cytosine-5)-methyltransferase 1
MIGIDLFCGAGGMTLGAVQAGIDVKFAIEYDRYAAETYSFNNPKIKVLNEDIRKIKEIPVKRKKNEQLVVFGGPPCQGFSTSNQRTRNKQNPNNWLFSEFVRIIKLTNPEWIVFENVKGFMTFNNGIFYEMVLNKFHNLGYQTSHFVLNASSFNVPQNRERAFILGSRNGIKINEIKGNDNKISVFDAIADLPILRNGSKVNFKKYRNIPQSNYAKKMRGNLKVCSNHFVTNNSLEVLMRYKFISQGNNWKSIPEHLMKSYSNRFNCHTGIYYRLKESEPSIVIGNYRKNMLIHPRQNRGLSVREAARIQSFPDSYQFHGTIGFQQQQVGNAVPPLLSEKVFNIIKSL